LFIDWVRIYLEATVRKEENWNDAHCVYISLVVDGIATHKKKRKKQLFFFFYGGGGGGKMKKWTSRQIECRALALSIPSGLFRLKINFQKKNQTKK
jgi:hypothetical protein